MKKIFYIAQREFLSTVATRGFMIGVFFPPVIIGVLIVLMPRLMNEKAPRIEGEVAILDLTGEVLEGFTNYVAPEAEARRRADLPKKQLEQVPDALRPLAEAKMNEEATRKALEMAMGEVPRLTVTPLLAGADIEREKDPLKIGKADEGGRRLAVAVVHSDAVLRAEGKERFGTWDLFVRTKLDDRIADEIVDGLRESVIAARVRKAGLDRATITALTEVPRRTSTTVTTEGETKTNEIFNVILPVSFMALLLMSVLISGQSLMTTTIEEKSSRVVEVLLSAISPMELMAGKVFGQMAAGLVILVIYSSLGVATLVSFALLGVLDWTLLVYLFLFFIVSFFLVASIMAAIGSAVNELREAQSFLTPVMMLLMVPYFLWLPISRNPNSMLAVVLSFLPPINSFAMLLRITSTSPPPAWQVILSLLVGAVAAIGALWAAGKIFRIGLLMYGKPPNFATLIRWIRMA